MENRVAPAIYSVTTNVTPGVGSLDEAISKANFNPGHDTIDFGPLFNLPQVIALANEIAITDSVTIIGTSAANVTIDGKNATRIFNTTGAPSTAVIRFLELTMKQGLAAGSGGAILAADETVTADYCNFDRNAAMKSGGAVAIESGGSFQSGRCQYTANTATELGGAIHVGGGATPSCVISQCMFNANAADQGGGLNVERQLQVYDSALYGNKTSSHGGGIRLTSIGGVGSHLITNSTISSNGAGGFGGGVAIEGTGSTLKVLNSTLTLNSASRGGGMAVVSGNGNVNLESTVVSKNVSFFAPDISTPAVVTYHYSALGSDQGVAILINQGNNLPLFTDAKLDTLNNNGGPTLTHGFLPGSPLLNTGFNLASLSNDQRGTGYLRTAFGATDIGAYEQQAPSIAPPWLLVTQVNDGTDQRSNVWSLRLVFSEAVMFPDGMDAAFRLERVGPGSPMGSVGLSFLQDGAIIIIGGMPGGTVPIESNGSLIDGKWELTVVAAHIMGANGMLDGNRDGVGIGDPTQDNVKFDFHRLFGDGDGDGVVSSGDFAMFRQTFGTGTNLAFDFTGDGIVNSDDFAEFRKRFGISISP